MLSSDFERAALIKFSEQVELSASIDLLTDYFTDKKKSSGGPIDTSGGNQGFYRTGKDTEVILIFEDAAGIAVQSLAVLF